MVGQPEDGCLFLCMPVARGGSTGAIEPPLASQGGSTGSIHHIRYSIHTPYTIHRTPQARNRTPPASEGGFDRFDIFHTSNRRAGHGGSVPLEEINGARKIAPTTPPRIYGTSTTTPPRNRPGKALELPPPRIYGTSTTTPPLEIGPENRSNDYRPPRNRLGKSLQLNYPPPRIYGTSTTTPPSKSARKIAPTTPPRIYGTSSTTPPVEIEPPFSKPWLRPCFVFISRLTRPYYRESTLLRNGK